MSVQTVLDKKTVELVEAMIDLQEVVEKGKVRIETCLISLSAEFKNDKPSKSFIGALRTYGDLFHRKVTVAMTEEPFNCDINIAKRHAHKAWNGVLKLVVVICFYKLQPDVFAVKCIKLPPTILSVIDYDKTVGGPMSPLQTWALVKNDNEWKMLNVLLASLCSYDVDSTTLMVTNFMSHYHVSDPRMVAVMDFYLETRFDANRKWVDMHTSKLKIGPATSDPSFPKFDDSIFDCLQEGGWTASKRKTKVVQGMSTDQAAHGDGNATTDSAAAVDGHDSDFKGKVTGPGVQDGHDTRHKRQGDMNAMPQTKKAKSNSRAVIRVLEENMDDLPQDIADSVCSLVTEFSDRACTSLADSHAALHLTTLGVPRLRVAVALAAMFSGDGETEKDALIELMDRVPVSLLFIVQRAPAVTHAFSAFQIAAEAFQVTSLLQFDAFLFAVLVGIWYFDRLDGLYWLDLTLQGALVEACKQLRIQLLLEDSGTKKDGKLVDFLHTAEKIAPKIIAAGKIVDSFPYAVSMMIELVKLAVSKVLVWADVEDLIDPTVVEIAEQIPGPHFVLAEFNVSPFVLSTGAVALNLELSVHGPSDIQHGSVANLTMLENQMFLPCIGWQSTSGGGSFVSLHLSADCDIAKLKRTLCDDLMDEGRRVLQKHPTAKDVLINHKATLMKVVQDILPPPELPLDSAPLLNEPFGLLEELWSKYESFGGELPPKLQVPPKVLNGSMEWDKNKEQLIDRRTKLPVGVCP